MPTQKPETLDQSGSSFQDGCPQDPAKCIGHTGANGISLSKTNVSISSRETEIREEKHPDLEHLQRHPKSQPATCTIVKSNQSKGEWKKESGNQKLVESTSMSSSVDCHHGAELFLRGYNDESPIQSTNNLSEDSHTTQMDSDVIQLGRDADISPVLSPGLSVLSLDSCDSQIQMFTDMSTCTQAQRNITDISESQWADIMDLFSVSSKDLAGCMDVEAYFESICECQGDAGQSAVADDVGFADESDSFTDRICSDRFEDPHSGAEYRFEYTHSCPGDQGLSINHSQSTQRQTEDAAKTHFNVFKPPQSTDIIQNQFCTSICYQYDVMSELQMYQHHRDLSPCMSVNTQNFAPFEGVAQSFSVPPLNPEDRPIQTPPHDDDWLFTDILKDRKSPNC